MNTIITDARKIINDAIQASLPDEAVKKAICGKEFFFDGKVIVITIGKAAWNMAKAAQKKRNHTPNHKDRQLRNPFASILVCGKCGAIMKRKTPKKDRSSIPWYQCPTRGCDCKMITGSEKGHCVSIS